MQPAYAIGAFAAVLAVVCLWVPGLGIDDTAKRTIVAVWTIGVPVWFFLEYWVLTPEKVKSDPALLGRLKYAQDLAGRIWIAITGVLVALYFEKW